MPEGTVTIKLEFVVAALLILAFTFVLLSATDVAAHLSPSR